MTNHAGMSCAVFLAICLSICSAAKGKFWTYLVVSVPFSTYLVRCGIFEKVAGKKHLNSKRRFCRVFLMKYLHNCQPRMGKGREGGGALASPLNPPLIYILQELKSKYLELVCSVSVVHSSLCDYSASCQESA